VDELTPRQQQVANLIAQGYSNVGIQEEMTLSRGSVENYVRVIFDRANLLPDPRFVRRVLLARREWERS